jgi:hypothetical protein
MGATPSGVVGGAGRGLRGRARCANIPVQEKPPNEYAGAPLSSPLQETERSRGVKSISAKEKERHLNPDLHTNSFVAITIVDIPR